VEQLWDFHACERIGFDYCGLMCMATGAPVQACQVRPQVQVRRGWGRVEGLW